MSTVFVNLTSLTPGTAPSVTERVSVKQGGKLTYHITWPPGPDTGSCQLIFKNDTQNPFTDKINGTTCFDFERKNDSAPALETLDVRDDANLGADQYNLVLIIDGETYVTDPMIVIKPT